jgi:diaminohydroxyphosphoribosylaminopyrimidine deaminase/5-amino-6-(5-phosphoribosylamino)uracil reductase
MAQTHVQFMRLALKLAQRAYGQTSPNPLVGAVLVKNGKILGKGWHHRAGEPHAEIEALHDAEQRGARSKGSTLYITLEPCSTHGRTPPCTDAITKAGIKRVVFAATDPNPAHRGRGTKILRRAGVEVLTGIEAEAAERLNEPFNHWIVQGLPFVTVKAAMSLDGKIATKTGESKWITGEKARAFGMKLRQGSDAILAGINTILTDDPALTFRPTQSHPTKTLRRIILDPRAQCLTSARAIADGPNNPTTIVVTDAAPQQRVNALAKKAMVITAPLRDGKIDLHWLLQKLGNENVTSLLVEGGGETNALFLDQGLAQRIVFFYAPKVIGGREARKGVAGTGNTSGEIKLKEVEWKKLGDDLLLDARVA